MMIVVLSIVSFYWHFGKFLAVMTLVSKLLSTESMRNFSTWSNPIHSAIS
jgi:hypothetical protein